MDKFQLFYLLAERPWLSLSLSRVTQDNYEVMGQYSKLVYVHFAVNIECVTYIQFPFLFSLSNLGPDLMKLTYAIVS